MAVLTIVCPPILRDTDVLLLGRIGRRSGYGEVPVFVADVDAVTMSVFHVPEGQTTYEQVGVDVDLDPNVVLFSTLQNGTIWTTSPAGAKYPDGFNFLVSLSRTFLAEAGGYQVRFDIDLASGDRAHGVYRLSARKLPGDS